jgi:predicted  nucleic acid-binding Zn-ribbon protein
MSPFNLSTSFAKIRPWRELRSEQEKLNVIWQNRLQTIQQNLEQEQILIQDQRQTIEKLESLINANNQQSFFEINQQIQQLSSQIFSIQIELDQSQSRFGQVEQQLQENFDSQRNEVNLAMQAFSSLWEAWAKVGVFS